MFGGREVFPELSVDEKLEDGSLYGKIKGVKEDYERVIIHFRSFSEKNQWAGTLSGGEQQMLAIGRALMTDPNF
jgi:branched-chain amino acid transport system ATP-binding protein